MLVLGIDYLNGWALASHPTDRNLPEWPPHPDRVLMALAAAHFETDGEAEERSVLEWLESQGPPAIISAGCRHRTTATTFVPVNDSADPIKKGKPLMAAGSLPIGRDRQPRTFPIAVPDHPQVWLTWSSAHAASEQLSRLQALCRKVTHIGHSASFVQMSATAALPDAATGSSGIHNELVPVDGGRYRFRVFGPGRLQDLEALFNKAAIDDYAALKRELSTAKAKRKAELKAAIAQQFGASAPQSLRPTPVLWHGYDTRASEMIASGGHHSDWSSDLLILAFQSHEGRRRFGLESTLQLTEGLRNTVMSLCPVDPLPEWLSGHQPDGRPSAAGHLAFLPLSHVGHAKADGHLLGLAVAVPRAVSRREVSTCLYPVLFDELGAPRDIELRLPRLGSIAFQLMDQRDHRTALRPQTWTAADSPSRRWATVTPIGLDRHAKGTDPWSDIAETIADGCERIGLPRPAVDAIIPSSVSMFVGAPASRDMPRLVRKHDHGKVRHVHAVVTFPEPVVGPVVVGAGRYRGYGLFRPLGVETLA